MTTSIAPSRLPLAAAAAAALVAFAAGVVAAPVLTPPLNAAQAFVQDTIDHDRRGARNVVPTGPTLGAVTASDPINQRGARIAVEAVPVRLMAHGRIDDTPRPRLAAR